MRRVYLLRAAIDFVPIYPLYAIMFASEGVSNLGISTLLIAWTVVALVAEVPSGVVGDRYDRRYVLAGSQVFMVLGFTVWLVAPNFIGYFAGFAFWGIGGAFFSGTYEAYLHDLLRERGEEDRFTEVFGRAEALALVAIVAASGAAALLVRGGYERVLMASAALAALIGLLALTLPPVTAEAEVDDDRYWSMLRAGVQGATSTPGLLRLLIASGATATVYGSIDEYAPLFTGDAGQGPSGIALAGAIFALTAAVGATLAGRRAAGRLSTLFLVTTSGLALLLAGLRVDLIGVGLLALHFALIQAADVQLVGRVQQAMPGALRATTTSVAGFFENVFSLAFFVALGALADGVGRPRALTLSGLAVLAIGLLSAVIGLRRGATALPAAQEVRNR